MEGALIGAIVGAQMGPIGAALGAGAMLIYGTWGLPGFGLADTPMNTGVGLDYLNRNYGETHIPNVVTSVLASYRGFDTLGETTVIFTAGVGVMAILGVVGGIRRRRREDEDGE